MMTHSIKLFFIIFLFILSVKTNAQNAGERLNIPFKNQNGEIITDALTGGLNNPQFSEIDLDNNGIQDLFIFDKTGNVILTFINNGTAGEVDYHFAPEYISKFPATIKEWCLLRDYNNDGIIDIFSYSSTPGIAGIDVHKGTLGAEGLSFELVQNFNNDYNLLSYPWINNLELEIYVSRDDIPTIADIDFDGDLDILTFSLVGDKMEYYKNQSVELGYGSDSLFFEFVDNCWGLFIESGTSSTIQLSTTENQCADLNESGGLHAGSTSVCWDDDGDGDNELLIGDITSTKLSFLQSSSTGINDAPWMDILDDNFPNNDVPVNMTAFPAPFVLDVNNDGRKDILVAPNDAGGSMNRNVVWWYKNTTTSGAGNYEYQQSDFLIENMIDFGQGTKPAFFDYNADGLLDIVVGTDGYFITPGTFDARLVLFENVGTMTSPEFQLIDDDWLNFSQYSDRNLAPAFGDLDNDGDKDLLVAQNDGKLFFLENTGGDNAAIFNTIIPEYKGISGGQECVPSIADLDGDGLQDIITGYKQGRMAFFKNIGSSNAPDFNPDRTMSPNIDGLGNVNVLIENDPRGYASPKVFSFDDNLEYRIISGSYFSNLHVFSNIMGNLNGDFTIESNQYASIHEGQETALDIADIDGDNYLDIIVGNYRGGLSFYKTDFKVSTVSIEEPQTNISYQIIPNPTNGFVEIKVDNPNTEVKIGIMDITGRWLIDMKKGKLLNISNLPNGVYMVAFELDATKVVKKLIKH